jgi:hypothetical protein
VGVHRNDQHVAQLAIATGSDTIVTQNLRHFPNRALAKHNLRAVSPGTLITEINHDEPSLIDHALGSLAQRWKNPSRTVNEILDLLEVHPTMADEAEAGYDLTKLRRRPGRPLTGSPSADVVPAARLDPEHGEAIQQRADHTRSTEPQPEALPGDSSSDSPGPGSGVCNDPGIKDDAGFPPPTGLKRHRDKLGVGESGYDDWC